MNFVKNYLLFLIFVVHELAHWLKRQKEKSFYFADPEEVESFAWGVLYEWEKGHGNKEVKEILYPILKKHFQTQKGVKKVFDAIIHKAKQLKQEFLDYENC